MRGIAQTLFAAVIASAMGVALACGSTDSAPVAAVDAAPAYVDSGQGFAQSACAACLGAECGPSEAACARQPTCARWAGCVGECPVSPTGDVDEACAAACPAPEQGPALEARDHHLTCTMRARPLPCSACGGQVASGPSVLSQVCPASEASSACARCEEEKCCKTAARCNGDPDCRRLRACSTACASDDDCRAGCYAASPESYVAYQQDLECRLISCSSPKSCNVPGWTPALECQFRECGLLRLECAREVECELLQACDRPCATAECTLDCDRRYPRGQKPRYALLACTELRCLQE